MSNISVLAESDDTTLCLRLTGMIGADEFDRYFHQEIEKRVANNDYFNMLVEYDSNFKGWEPEAAERNFKSILSLSSKPRKLAYINPPEQKIVLMKYAKPLLSGEIKYFDSGHFSEALNWIKE